VFNILINCISLNETNIVLLYTYINVVLSFNSVSYFRVSCTLNKKKIVLHKKTRRFDISLDQNEYEIEIFYKFE
jgi:hypothetical protein